MNDPTKPSALLVHVKSILETQQPLGAWDHQAECGPEMAVEAPLGDSRSIFIADISAALPTPPAPPLEEIHFWKGLSSFASHSLHTQPRGGGLGKVRAPEKEKHLLQI